MVTGNNITLQIKVPFIFFLTHGEMITGCIIGNKGGMRSGRRSINYD